jgi:uncharacterized protein YjbI with pentapeptide repeats
MAKPDHLARLTNSVPEWNSWRTANQGIKPDLSEAYLSGADLKGADLSEANLIRADLSGADLSEANLIFADLTEANLQNTILREASLSLAKLSRANLSRAYLRKAYLKGTNLNRAILKEANLSEADFSGANLHYAVLRGANLSIADLSRANLRGADLMRADLILANLYKAILKEANLAGAVLIQTNLTKANLTGCAVYGLSAWDVQLEGTIQSSLVITRPDVPTITVDNLAVAQFIYLLLNNKNVRHVIDTITSKVVLILGRFTPERKQVLDAIREELRERDYLPVLFDFEKPSNKTTLETVSTLAHMARFVIADLTDATSVLQELQAIVPTNPSVAVQPLILNSQSEPGMFDFFRAFPWMLRVYRYKDQDALLAAITDKVIGPAEARAKKLIGR